MIPESTDCGTTLVRFSTELIFSQENLAELWPMADVDILHSDLTCVITPRELISLSKSCQHDSADESGTRK